MTREWKLTTLPLSLSPTVIIAKVVRKFYTNNQVFYKIVIKKEYKVGGELSPGEGIAINTLPLSLLDDDPWS